MNTSSRELSPSASALEVAKSNTGWAVHNHFSDRIVHSGHEQRPVGASIHDHQNRDYYANTVCLLCPDRYGAGVVANGRLIAAAPALLESVRELKEILRFALLSTTPEIAREAMTFIRKADAAVAKADPTQ